MGRDLTLLPIDHDGHPVLLLSHVVLSVCRRDELFQAIRQIESAPLESGLHTYVAVFPNGELGYGLKSEDDYGTPLRWVNSGDLAKLDSHPGVIDNWRNRAIWAYLRELPQVRVVLDWS